MISWFNEGWRDLRRKEIRPTPAQWTLALAIGLCMTALFAALCTWILTRTQMLTWFAFPLGVFCAGSVIANCIGLNLRRNLAPSRAAVGLMQLFTLALALVSALLTAGPRGLVVSAIHLPVVLMFPLSVLVPVIFSFARNPPNDRPICARCKYPFIELNSPERCPECGSQWLLLGGHKLPQPTLSARAKLVGAALFLPGLALVALPFSLHRGGWQPTTLLRWVATSNSFQADAAFLELATRPLAPSHVRELAKHLLDRSHSDILTPRAGMIWLEGLALSGSLPSDLHERYFADMRIPVLKVTTPVVGGDQAVAIVGFNNRAFIAPGADAYVFVHAFDVLNEHGAAVPTEAAGLNIVQQTTSAIWSTPYQPGPPPSDLRAAPVRSQFPNVVFVPDKPGRYRVRAEVWSVAMPTPQGAAFQPAFDSRGALIPPPDALFVKRFELEDIVEVRPPDQRAEPTSPASPPG